ncbi:PLIN3 protein, partial [Cochlearius cochlearius]|nr:PLIN3 protein [Cochlearius cochlearius]
AVQGGMERTRSVLSTGVGSVVGSRVGRLLATGVDAVLGKSEELVERYLPGTDEELEVTGEATWLLVTPSHDPGASILQPGTPMSPGWGAELGGPIPAPGCSGAGRGVVQPRSSHPGPGPAAVAAGVEVASQERQRRRQSYFVRVGSLSAKLRHRALRR